MSDAKGIIHRKSGCVERTRQLGPYRIEGYLEREEEIGQTVWRVSIGPNVTTAISYHKAAEETYFVLRGGGVAWLNGVSYPLEAGDFLRLPAGTRHGFVTGPDGLEMLDVHAPGCWPDRDTFFEGEAPPGWNGGR